MKVKIFSSITSTDDLENKIANWTKDFNPKIISINTTAQSMCDYYLEQPSTVCNFWVEYVCSIIYE